MKKEIVFSKEETFLINEMIFTTRVRVYVVPETRYNTSSLDIDLRERVLNGDLKVMNIIVESKCNSCESAETLFGCLLGDPVTEDEVHSYIQDSDIISKMLEKLKIRIAARLGIRLKN